MFKTLLIMFFVFLGIVNSGRKAEILAQQDSSQKPYFLGEDDYTIAERVPGEIKDFIQLGRQYGESKDFSQAREYFEKALKGVKKGSPEYVSILKWTLMANSNVAAEYAFQGLFHEQLNTLNRTLFFVEFKEKGDGLGGLVYLIPPFVQLEEGLQNILILIYNQLIECYYNLGNKEDAKKYLKKLESYNTEFGNKTAEESRLRLGL